MAELYQDFNYIGHTISLVAVLEPGSRITNNKEEKMRSSSVRREVQRLAAIALNTVEGRLRHQSVTRVVWGVTGTMYVYCVFAFMPFSIVFFLGILLTASLCFICGIDISSALTVYTGEP